MFNLKPIQIFKIKKTRSKYYISPLNIFSIYFESQQDPFLAYKANASAKKYIYILKNLLDITGYCLDPVVLGENIKKRETLQQLRGRSPDNGQFKPIKDLSFFAHGILVQTKYFTD